MPDADEPDWKLRLRYGKLKTPYQHYTLLADGMAATLRHGFECRPGRAWMAMKVWATSQDEAFDMVRAIGADIGFEANGRIELFDTPPEEPPEEKPRAYGIGFTPYDEDSTPAP